MAAHRKRVLAKEHPGRIYGPVKLDPEFPIASYDFVQRDREIRALHAHNGLELGYCYAGSGIFVVEDKVLPYTAGDVAVISPREMHLARSVLGTVSEWNFTTLDPLKLLYAFPEDAAFHQVDDLCGSDFSNIFKPQHHPGLGPLLFRIITELKQKGPGYRALVRGLVQTFLVEVHRTRPARPARKGASTADPRASERVTAALDLIASGYNRSIPIEEMAAACHMSVTNFRRTFKAGLGIAPLEYLTRFRIHMAMGLLESRDMAVIAIAMDVGYETLSCFNRNFKRIAGCSPREWKKRGKAASRQAVKAAKEEGSKP